MARYGHSPRRRPRAYGTGYDPDVTRSILRQLGQALREGELPTLRHFKQPSRMLRRYLTALEDVFLLRKLPCHEAGVGKDAWLVSDGGLATEIMGTPHGEGATLSLCRIFLINEILSSCESAGQRLLPLYYKSARGSPVDLIWKDTLIKVSVLPIRRLDYDRRPMAAALKSLGLKAGVIAVPRDESESDGAIRVVSLTQWS